MTDEEASFAVESALLEQSYEWSDKHRPRKPRYFNRVHTGFEWNKYNQTHYDVDNPPPKIVQVRQAHAHTRYRFHQSKLWISIC